MSSRSSTATTLRRSRARRWRIDRVPSDNGSRRRNSSEYSPRSLFSRASAERIALVFAFAKPPTRIASSTSAGFARARRDTSGNRCISEEKARSRFASVVFWERIVRIRFRTGSSSWAHRPGRPNLAQRRREMPAILVRGPLSISATPADARTRRGCSFRNLSGKSVSRLPPRRDAARGGAPPG